MIGNSVLVYASHNHHQSHSTCTYLPHFDRFHVIDVAAGLKHIMVLLANNIVLVMGDNEHVRVIFY